MATSDDFLLAIRGYFNLAVDTEITGQSSI